MGHRLSSLLSAVLIALLVSACSKSESVRVVMQYGPIQPRRVAFHPQDASRLLVLEVSGTVSIWDLKEPRQPVKVLQFFANALDAAFSSDGKAIVTVGHNGRVSWWDEEGHMEWTSSEGDAEPARAVAVAGDDGVVVTGGGEGTLKLWATNGTAQGRQKAHEGIVLSLAVSAHGDLIATVGMDQLVKLWKREQGSTALEEQILSDVVRPGMAKLLPNLIARDPMWGWDHALAFSPDGKLIAAADYDGGVRLWNSDGTPHTPQIKGHQGHYARAVAFSPRGDIWASAGFDGNIKLWDLNGAERATMIAHRGPALSVSFSADGEMVATAGFDDRVTLWKSDGTLIGTMPIGPVSQILSAAFLSRGESFVTGTATGLVRIWSLDGLPKSGQMAGHQGPVASVAISPRGGLIASGGQDGRVRFWYVNGTPGGEPKSDQSGQIISLAFSPRGDTLAAGGRAVVRLWNLDATPREDLTGLREMVFTLAYSPSGNLLAGGDLDGGLMIWNANGSSRAGPIFGKHWGAIRSLAFAPDGETIATAGEDATVRLWKTDGSEIGEPLKGPTAPLRAVMFSATGDRVIAGGLDGTLWIWKLPSRQLEAKEIGLPIDQIMFSDTGSWVRAGGGYFLLLDDDFAAIAWMYVTPDGAVAATKDGYYSGSGPTLRAVRLFRGADTELTSAEATRLYSAERVAADTGG